MKRGLEYFPLSIPFLVCVLALYWGVLRISCASARELTIGVLLPLNGKLAIAGDMEKKAAELALEQVNGSEGSVSGLEIVLKFADTSGEPEAAKKAMEELIADQASAIIGGCSSTATLAAAEVAEEHGIPFLITTASADKITEMDMKYVFRLCLPSSEYPRPISALLRRNKRLWRAAILRENSRFGHFHTRNILKVCRKARVLITDIISYPAGAHTDEALYFPRLQEARPQILFIFSNDSEAVRALALCEAMEAPPRLLITKGDPFLNASTFLEAQVSGKNVYTTCLWDPSVSYPGAKEFFALFYEKYGFGPDYHAAQAYAAMQIMADAITRALSPDPEGIRDALEQTDTMTIYGPVKFESYGHKDRQNRPSAILLRWSTDRLEPVSYSKQ